MFLDPEKPVEKHRANLPHWQQQETWVFLTWRLADSLPEAVVAKFLLQKKDWENVHPKLWDDEKMRDYNRLFSFRFESLLDDCHGSCCLREESVGEIVSGALLHFEGERHELDAFVVMPNHVHVLFRTINGHKMEAIIHSWKRFTAREINKALGRSGSLWQTEYWDRLVRSREHFEWTRKYITGNPAKLPPNTFQLWKKEYGEGV